MGCALVISLPPACLGAFFAGVVPDGLEEDDDKDNIGDATIGQHFDAKNRQSVRNLRIREGTAKFLFNLDPNSAHYDQFVASEFGLRSSWRRRPSWSKQLRVGIA